MKKKRKRLTRTWNTTWKINGLKSTLKNLKIYNSSFSFCCILLFTDYAWPMCPLTKFLGSFVFCDMWHGRCVPERFIRCAMDDVHSTPGWDFFTLNRRLLGFVKCDPELDLLAKLCEAESRVLLKPVSWWSIQPAPCIMKKVKQYKQ